MWRTRWGRFAVAITIIVSSGVIATYASASFSGTKQVAQSAVAAGKMSATLANGDASQAFTVSISGLYPGASATREIDLTLGTLDFKTLGVYIATDCVGCQRSALDTSGDLTLKIERCSVAWTMGGSSPNRTYSCSGTTTTPLSATAIGTIANESTIPFLPGTTSLTTGSAVTASSVNCYLFTFALSSSAASGDQGATSIYKFTFQGTQRDAAAQ
jgi:hypothetical protein